MTNANALTVLVAEDALSVQLQGGAELRDQSAERVAKAILRLLDEKRVVAGIDHQAVNQAAETISIGGALPQPLLVASAMPGELELPRCVFRFANEVTETVTEEGPDSEALPLPLILAPLVAPETVLATLEGAAEEQTTVTSVLGEPVPFRHDWKRMLHLGDHVRPSSNSRAICAARSGYPELIRGADDDLDTLRLVPLATISEDHMQAYATLRPPLDQDAPPSVDVVLELLRADGITFGHRTRTLLQGLDRICRTGQPRTVLAARGLQPQNGNDAYLQFAMEVGPIPGKVLGNGRIDFRERNMFVGVSEGQLIARKVAATPGVPGKDIHGNPIQQQAGADMDIKVSDDAAFDAETGEVRALRSGVLSKVSDTSVRVCSCQVISGDINYEIGNIVSRNALQVKGSIESGFRVHALGDIEIGGNVSNARVRSDGNIVIKGGITGTSSGVRARGDIDTKFLEHGRMFSRGSIIIRKSSYHCRAHALKALHMEAGAKAVASQLVSGGSMTLGSVGADAAAPSLIAAAVDPDRLQLHYDLGRDLMAKEEELDHWRLRHGQGGDPKTLERLETEVRHCRRSLERLNMIPNTGLEDQSAGYAAAMACEIKAAGTVHEGTIVRIGNLHLELPKTLSRVRFHLQYSAEAGREGALEIAITPMQR